VEKARIARLQRGMMSSCATPKQSPKGTAKHSRHHAGTLKLSQASTLDQTQPQSSKLHRTCENLAHHPCEIRCPIRA
jgi:hypothetical protein